MNLAKETSAAVVLGKRRFVCVSPTVVHMEFCPDGSSDERPTIIVPGGLTNQSFVSQEQDGEWTVLKTSQLEVRTRENDRAFSGKNLEIRWIMDGLLQYWRHGDMDYQNLGGTLRSLDRYGAHSEMNGVHIADGSHPDSKGLDWLAWMQCEDDVPFYAASPDAGEGVNAGDWHRFAADGDHEGRLLERTFNKVHEAHQFTVGMLSKSGYFVLNDSDAAVLDDDGFPVERDTPGYESLYFFGYGRDYRQAMQDFVSVCGRPSLPTRNSFGIIFSRWPAWHEDEARELVETFDEKGYPLSTLVLDMEWHKEGWGHWDWNTGLYSDPAAFFKWCHERGLEVTLNDHPLDVRADDSHYDAYVESMGDDVVIRKDVEYNGKNVDLARVDITNKAEASNFLQICHTHILEDGLDYWWNDGTRGRLSNTWGQLIGNKQFFEESERDGKRGMLLARHGGWGNHRYGAFFTGDTGCEWSVLKTQVEFNIRAGQLGISNVSHDMGGFCTAKSRLQDNSAGEAIIDPVMYIRWLQFGVFNPIMRFHCAPGSGSRQPWDYDLDHDDICRHWLRLRNSLIPYIYSAAREHYETGTPIVRGMYLDAPRDKQAYRFDQFYFGNHLLVAPVTNPEHEVSVYLPEGDWYDFETMAPVEGGQVIQRNVELKDCPVYAPAGAIICRQNPDDVHSVSVADLQIDVFPGADGETILYEDDGRSIEYKEAGFSNTQLKLTANGSDLCLTMTPIEGTHSINRRTISLRLPSAPSAVRVNGAEIDVDFDGDLVCLGLVETVSETVIDLAY